jgi:hypothetical protein
MMMTLFKRIWAFARMHSRNNSTARSLELLLKQQEILLMKISEILPILTVLLATLNKVSIEFVTRIATLESLITAQSANGDVPAEVVAELEALKAAAQALDDLNADTSAAVDNAQLNAVAETPEPVAETPADPSAETPVEPEQAV